MSLPYIKRLSSSQIFFGEDPWNFMPVQPIPAGVLGTANKKARDAWANAPATDHNFYAGFLGSSSSSRISAAKSDETGNPPHSVLALIGDYDSPMREEMLMQCIEGQRFKPNWVEKTMSGNWRLVWLLEEPLKFPSYEFATHFLKTFSTFAFDPGVYGAGFDEGAWINPTRYYTNSGDWRPCADEPIPAALAQGWLVKAAEKFKWSKAKLGVELPMDVVIPALAERYPDFARWPGTFAPGAQGPSFWIQGSVSPKSALVKEMGIYSFAAHATKAFYTWSDLLGHDFVKEKVALQAASRVEDICFDGMSYWRKSPEGLWIDDNKDRIFTHLKCSRGVSAKPNQSGVSDLDNCLEHIHNHQRVSVAAPFCFRPPGLFVGEGGTRFLNLGTPPVLTAAPDSTDWGPTGKLPWLSEYMSGFFTGDELEQLERFLAWFKRFYSCGVYQEPQPGQAVFISGPTGVGKTFLAQAVIGGLVGGSVGAARYLLGKDDFGSNLFNSNLWTIDDGEAAANGTAHRAFTERVKRIVANHTAEYHPKFKVPCQITWMGRLIVTLNGDALSLAMLPSTDRSNQEKLMFFQAAERQVDFMSPQERREMLDRELPYLARWLLDWQPPEHCGYGRGRFGVEPFAHTSLSQSAHHSGAASGFKEVLDMFLKIYFTNNPAATEWRGTATALHQDIIMGVGGIEEIMRGYKVGSVKTYLGQIQGWQDSNLVIAADVKDNNKVWIIQKPDNV